jgi:SNF family Na+-dependent transporter
MAGMRGYLTSIFIYIFMVAAIASAICALSLIVLFLRYSFATVGETERKIAHYILIIFISGVITVPVSLYIVDRLERVKD